MSITTKQGDSGTTRIGSGESLSKADPRIEVLGTLDELQCALGVARAAVDDRRLGDEIRSLQAKLFEVGGMLADVASCRRAITDSDVDELSAKSSMLEKKHEQPRKFVISGETVVSAHLDVARATARRLERRLVALEEEEKKGPERGTLLAWINRLSDYIWLLARVAESGERLTRVYPLNIAR